MGWTVGKVGWRAPAGGVYRIYALGQSLSSGSNAIIEWDATTETSSGDIDIALEEVPFAPGVFLPAIHQVGSYSASAFVDFGGTVFPADINAQIDAFDMGAASASAGDPEAGVDPIVFDTTVGAPLTGYDVDGRVTIADLDGYFSVLAGPGLHSGTTITTATYLEITKHA